MLQPRKMHSRWSRGRNDSPFPEDRLNGERAQEVHLRVVVELERLQRLN
jgi:hypothetical protein